MVLSAEILRVLHQLHQQITDLRSRLERGPKQVTAAGVALTKREEEHASIRETVKQTKMMSDGKLLQLKTNEDHILDTRRKLNACSTNREYQAFIDQIAADEMANSVLSDEILELMERIDQLEEKSDEATVSIEKAVAHQVAISEKVSSEQTSLESDLERLVEELKEAEKQIPAEIKVEYNRVVKARGEEALAPVDGESCGGCYNRQTLQTMSILKLGKPVFCSSCGSLLYIPE